MIYSLLFFLLAGVAGYFRYQLGADGPLSLIVFVVALTLAGVLLSMGMFRNKTLPPV